MGLEKLLRDEYASCFVRVMKSSANGDSLHLCQGVLRPGTKEKGVNRHAARMPLDLRQHPSPRPRNAARKRQTFMCHDRHDPFRRHLNPHKIPCNCRGSCNPCHDTERHPTLACKTSLHPPETFLRRQIAVRSRSCRFRPPSTRNVVPQTAGQTPSCDSRRPVMSNQISAFFVQVFGCIGYTCVAPPNSKSTPNFSGCRLKPPWWAVHPKVSIGNTSCRAAKGRYAMRACANSHATKSSV